MATVLIPLPSTDFDPTETAVPWQTLAARGHRVLFATPDGRPAQADPRMLDGNRLGPLKPILRADANARRAHAAMVESAAFRQPIAWADIAALDYDGLLLPGGHAPGMRPYLESPLLQAAVADSFARGRPVGAVCHGVLVVSRARGADGRSVLYGRRTTGLLAQQELAAWWLTRAWLGDYYRTYPQTVQDEVTAVLARPEDFVSGPTALRRDSPERLELGFVVRDGNYVSARWPGDVHRLAEEFAGMLAG
ncbi:type 1 glutamine amidotransferase domain-containing protein [Chitinimonas koreensis]|uniref:type 1 glutamine amidotransferase domain-containing protein n=1 Tax=Chitinimonas koreensis TaxID=356302 RepID=UPI00041563D4|nr:type 1 glutamine amidotransferase domain-containing protein [Chitinimonas koreensis]